MKGRIICAWCGKDMGASNTELNSHGICEQCSLQVEKETEEELKGERKMKKNNKVKIKFQYLYVNEKYPYTEVQEYPIYPSMIFTGVAKVVSGDDTSVFLNNGYFYPCEMLEIVKRTYKKNKGKGNENKES